ncbi:MAG: UDP-N-acetylmuramoyl-tripeptide--D-alanyl-D-alanine ligase [Chitinophagales bacterium]|nr:UDP-N-acetylmuramoyl-tripeptide--D-alanyl-D-alanine ligase [Chitinophagales bacterium]
MMQAESLYQLFTQSSGICTDTRNLEKGNIFFSLKGQNFNGNQFALQALEAGASHAVMDENLFPDQENVILVEDVLKTLQRLANQHRKQINGKVIAICGSNGKTTTKELCRAVLETSFKTVATKGNLNNQIGVPLTLLSIPKETEMAVIEMGASHLSETAALCEIAEPDHGIITNNGKDHLEGYENEEGVRNGNGELFNYLKKKKGVAFVSTAQKDLLEMSADLKRMTYGSSDDSDIVGKITGSFPFLKVEIMNREKDKVSWGLATGDWKLKTAGEDGEIIIQTQLAGSYNFENVMAAACIGKFFGVPMKKIEEAISSYCPSMNRSQVLNQDGNTFILDAYNANPSSMQAAVESFALIPKDHKIVIAGDMLELGDHSAAEHREILQLINENNFEKRIFIGPEFGKVFTSNNHSLHFNTVFELKDWFKEQKFSDYYFLLKGSRLIELEKLLV